MSYCPECADLIRQVDALREAVALDAKETLSLLSKLVVAEAEAASLRQRVDAAEGVLREVRPLVRTHALLKRIDAALAHDAEPTGGSE